MSTKELEWIFNYFSRVIKKFDKRLNDICVIENFINLLDSKFDYIILIIDGFKDLDYMITD